jgi:hypothetical protein
MSPTMTWRSFRLIRRRRRRDVHLVAGWIGECPELLLEIVTNDPATRRNTCAGSRTGIRRRTPDPGPRWTQNPQ